MTASADQGCRPVVEAAEVDGADAVESWPGATAVSATAAMTINDATTVDHRCAGQRPRNHPAIASRSKLTSSAASTAAPYALAITHANQITVPKIGTETACFNTSIHTPGRGRMRVQAG